MKSKRTKELRRFGVSSVNMLEQKCEAYFASPPSPTGHPTLLGLCRALGVRRDELLFYPFDEDIRAVLDRAKTRVEAALEEELLQNPKNANAIIFLLKCNFGWGEEASTAPAAEEKIFVELGE